jgi:hypothetical protein
MRLSLAMTLLLSCGCNSNFDKASHISGLRVLGVRAEPPEVAPGATTTLTPLIFDSVSETATIDWAFCTKSSGPSGPAIDPDCLNNETAPYLVPLGSGLTITATVPMLTLSDFGAPDETEGVYLPVRARIRTPSDAIDAIYQLRIHLAPTVPNQNPTLTGLFQGDGTAMPLDEKTPVPVQANGQLMLHSGFTDASKESYPILDSMMNVKMVPETLSLSWYASAGSFSDDSAGPDVPNTYTADTNLPASGSAIDLFVVGRDDRGGIDWLHRTLILR